MKHAHGAADVGITIGIAYQQPCKPMRATELMNRVLRFATLCGDGKCNSDKAAHVQLSREQGSASRPAFVAFVGPDTVPLHFSFEGSSLVRGPTSAATRSLKSNTLR